MIKDHSNSGKLNDECLCEYSNIRYLSVKTFTGYKLVREKNLNFYSVATGMFRYKTGPIDKIHAKYHTLYENTPQFREEMVGKTGIFSNVEDLKKFYPTWSEGDNSVTILKIVLGGELISMDAKSPSHSCEVVAGSEIISMKKICTV